MSETSCIYPSLLRYFLSFVGELALEAAYSLKWSPNMAPRKNQEETRVFIGNERRLAMCY